MLKKNIHFTTNISVYTITDILKFYGNLFCTYCNSFCVFKNSHYAYIPLHMHKTLPTFGNEKEQ